MAGIGFELRKIYNEDSIFSKQKAYGYASIIYAGPMLLGMLLVAGVVYLSLIGGLDKQSRDVLLGMISYSMLASLTVNNFFSLIVTRYVSDMLYEKKLDRIMPSFFASSSLILLIGSVCYGIFLLLSGISAVEVILCLILYGELAIVWNAMNYLTAVKDYKSIILSFFAAIAVTLFLGYLTIVLNIPYGLLISVCVAYGVMLLWTTRLLAKYFPTNHHPSFEFLIWFDRFSDLFKVGLYLFIGLFSHIIIIWFSPLGRSLVGLFRTAPNYDVPAMLAYLTTLVSTINFVVSVEVFFYPKFKEYYRLYNERGSLLDIKEAEVEMLEVLHNEMKYLSWKQLLATILVMFVGELVLTSLPLGFNAQMSGYFKTLCLGYGLYAVGNSDLLILLYFSDYKGAKFCARLFGCSSAVLTLLSTQFDQSFYGYGFLVAGVLLYVGAYIRLNDYVEDLPYHVLGSQTLIPKTKSGLMSKLANRLSR